MIIAHSFSKVNAVLEFFNRWRAHHDAASQADSYEKIEDVRRLAMLAEGLLLAQVIKQNRIANVSDFVVVLGESLA